MAPRPFEYRVMRYAPNPLQEVAANIGVILLELRAEGSGFADVRLTQDWRMVRLLDPHFDYELFVELAKRLRSQLNSQDRVCSSGGVEMSEREWILHILADSFSNSVQISAPRVLMISDPIAAMRELMRQYCEFVRPLDADAPRTLTGRPYIKWRLQEEFRLAGVSEFLEKDIEAAKFTSKGDGLKIDFGYVVPPVPTARTSISTVSPVRELRLFQAVALKNDPDKAKILAFSWPRLREGILRAGYAHGTLTAVIEDDLNRQEETIDFAMETMLKEGLVLRQVSQVAEIAEQARRDLRL